MQRLFVPTVYLKAVFPLEFVTETNMATSWYIETILYVGLLLTGKCDGKMVAVEQVETPLGDVMRLTGISSPAISILHG